MLKRVFQPIRLADTTFPNRIVMGSMHVGLEALEGGMERLAAFYAERARGGAGLIVTGGAGVCPEGGLGNKSASIYADEHVEQFRPVTNAVHREGGKIFLQLFHAGRYAYKEMTGLDPVAPSPIQAPINRTAPRELRDDEIEQTIEAFAAGARRAQAAGFDGVEIMGSEGYLINQFLSPVTNRRTDRWGGDLQNRSRFALEIARRVRTAVGKQFPVIFRMSGLDLIPHSTTLEETIRFAQMLEETGVDALNIGIGWHESQVPTIAMMVPRGSFVWVASEIKTAVTIPVIGSNRINDLRLAEQYLQEGLCDMVSLARPFLADPQIVNKSMDERFDEVNTCIACNQACLDHIFSGQPASCLVNPEAGREHELAIRPAAEKKRIAVVGAGPAGMEAARVLALRGHQVVLFERDSKIGGQLNYARQVPDKQEFDETLRYYRIQLANHGVKIRYGTEVSAERLVSEGFEEVISATGVIPRQPELPGIDLPHVVSYADVFEGRVDVGQRVVIVGAGGIACDLAHLLTDSRRLSADTAHYLLEWGVLDTSSLERLKGSKRSVTMLRRGKQVGTGLGKTTRWAVLARLKHQGVTMLTEVAYREITEEGVRIIHEGHERILSADTVVIAAGATPNNRLADELRGVLPVHVIGGAREAGELDAKRAILEGALLARQI
ncbi:FAD-dependent oxidoreductase [Brevibacillus humidisoli]|uniref:NADPH-dependent 2,4-dienoyl-CoA reductase n=1 Tax=Brevibacillus humidisoli TaxID=2895522 RepID=UPI001E394715|nr:NADPH-dependent 2,4-dienoyl-CoA reductase [Brevibacillus humidisoli]UFJ41655.1 FAD-dependent oxidoreductase [Brevibacillus humidisoli]